MIHAGNDFPPSIEATLQEWQIRLVLEKHRDKQSTRGLLQYRDSNFDGMSFATCFLELHTNNTAAKTFSYVNPVLKVTPDILLNSGLLEAKILHFLDTPRDLVSHLRRIEELRATHPMNADFVVWEPTSAYCTPRHLDSFYDAVKRVDFFSPNHAELMGLFGESQASKRGLERMAVQFVTKGINPLGRGSIIVRAGEHGCLVCSSSKAPTWIPAFYETGSYGPDRAMVVDTTGAGNAFLGAFMVGFHKSGDVIKAAQWGTIAASFALEQTGLPKLTRDSKGQELWNGVRFVDRLRAYQALHEERASRCMNFGGMNSDV